MLGVLYLEAEDHGVAERALTKATSVDASVPQYHFNLAGVLRARGSFRAAIESFTRARALDKALVSDVVLAETWMLLGEKELKAGRAELAAEAFLAALRLKPGFADYPPLMVAAESAIGLDVLRQVNAGMPGSAAVLEKLAYCAATTGEENLGKKSFAKLANDLGASSPELLRFHETYNEGLARTKTLPAFRRRRRFQSLLQVFESVLGLSGDVAVSWS